MPRVGFALLLPALLAAQDVPAPTFRTSTRLVQVDVVVKASRVPAKGLTKEDFQVFDNGKQQQISVFSVRDLAVAQPVRRRLSAGAVTNRPQAEGAEPVSATVIVIDGLNTYPEHQGYARLQALKYLDRATRHELVSVLTLDTTLKVRQPLTDDRDLLRRAIDGYRMTQSLFMQDGQNGLLAGLKGNAANAARASNFQRQADITTAAFATVARHMRGLPGRKKLIWISAALPLTFTQENERNMGTMTEFTNLSAPLFAAMKMMNDANVAIYPVDPRGVMGPFEGLGLMDPNLAAMNQLAQRTGGKAFYNDNDLATGIEEAFSDTDLTYTLGFYTDDQSDGRVHSLSVKVNLPGADVRYRQTYSAEDPVKPLTEKVRKATLSAWVQEPLDPADIEIQAAAVPAPNKPGDYLVEVAVDVGGLRLKEENGLFTGSIELAIVPDVEKKPKGLRQVIKVHLTPEKLQEALTSGGMLVLNQIHATDKKGKLLSPRLHVVVMDGTTGKAGSVRIPIQQR